MKWRRWRVIEERQAVGFRPSISRPRLIAIRLTRSSAERLAEAWNDKRGVDIYRAEKKKP